MQRLVKFLSTILLASCLPVAAQASGGFPDDVRTVHLIVNPDQPLGETRTAASGDVVYADRRSAVYRSIAVNDHIQRLCFDGVCHNVPRDAVYEQVPYGLSIYCTREPYAESSALFGKSQVHSCIRAKNSSDLSKVEIFSISNFKNDLRIMPRETNMGNYLRLEEKPIESLSAAKLDSWSHYFAAVEVRYLGAADGRIRFRVISRDDESVVRNVSFPYEEVAPASLSPV